MRKEKNPIPEDWNLATNRPPTYKRRDGYVVKLDGPGRWGIRYPGEKMPRFPMPSASEGMAWVDSEHPLEQEQAHDG